MKRRLRSLLFLLMTLFKGRDAGITLSNKIINVEVYTDPVTWNDAQLYCNGKGGHLFTQNSKEREYVVEKYQQESSWPHEDLWLGLHNPAGDSDSEYGFNDCIVQNLTQYGYWKTSEPKTPDTDRCAVIDKNSREWKSSTCNDNKGFVCEISAGTCTFGEFNQTPTSTAVYEQITLSETDKTSCWNQCLQTTNNNMNCWALNWITGSISNNCVLYFVENPFYFDSSTLETNAGMTLLIKDCYTFSSSSETVTSSENSADPVQGCGSLAPATTTTTTTTTPAKTTTSTAPAPTTTTTTQAQTTVATPVPITTTITHAQATTSTPTQTTTTTTTPVPTTTTTHTSPTASTSTTGKATTPVGPTVAITSSTLIATSTASSSTTQNSTGCGCGCSILTSLFNSYTRDPVFANLSVEDKIIYLQERLKLDTTVLSSTVRKKTSANDDRPQSKAIGYVGVTFICIVFVPIVLSDAIRLLAFLHGSLKKSSQIDTIENS